MVEAPSAPQAAWLGTSLIGIVTWQYQRRLFAANIAWGTNELMAEISCISQIFWKQEELGRFIQQIIDV